MISILALTLLLSLVKLMFEDSLLIILMTMEMVSMLTFFSIIGLNLETLSLTNCTVTMLTMMISESVLSLTMFISLLRNSSSEKVTSMSLNY